VHVLDVHVADERQHFVEPVAGPLQGLCRAILAKELLDRFPECHLRPVAEDDGLAEIEDAAITVTSRRSNAESQRFTGTITGESSLVRDNRCLIGHNRPLAGSLGASLDDMHVVL
jgi:hypothetical protein